MSLHPRSWSFLLWMAQASRASWTRWRLSRVSRREKRAERRLLLLLTEADSQQLRLKELRLLRNSLAHRQAEEQESREFRQQQILPPPEPKPEPPQVPTAVPPILLEDPVKLLRGVPPPPLPLEEISQLTGPLPPQT